MPSARDLYHTPETGQRGLQTFNTPDAPNDLDNSQRDWKAIPSVPRESSVPATSPPVPSAACFLPLTMAAAQSRAATLQIKPAHHPRSAEHDTLLNPDNTSDHVTSRSTTSQSHAGSDWRQWFRIFQGRDAAPSPVLRHAEEYWEFTPPWSRNIDLPDTCGSFFQVDDHYIDNNAYISLGHPVTLAEPLGRAGASKLDTSDSISHNSMPKPEPTACSKIATLFSKLKAYIKAPFLRHKQ
ncbi:hypothetical protein MBLNU13_g06785t1 [Cladosporium sp. NU13]